MNSPTPNGPVSPRSVSARFALERGLAPHVDEEWAEAFILELRLLGVAGTTIGAALSEVESHCADSGAGAETSFGAATEYALSLSLPVSGDQSARATAIELAPTAVQLAGMFAVNWSFDAVLNGRPLEITAGHLALLVIMAAAIALLARFAEPILRVVVQRSVAGPIALAGGSIATIAACVAALLLLDTTVWSAPAAWCLGAGAVTLFAGSAWALQRTRRSVIADPIRLPEALERPVPVAASRLGRVIASPAFAVLSAVAVIPLGTVGLLALTLVLRSMTGE